MTNLSNQVFRTIIIGEEFLEMARDIAQAAVSDTTYFDSQIINQEDGPVFARIMSGMIDPLLAAAFDSVAGAMMIVNDKNLTYTSEQVEMMLLCDGSVAPGYLRENGTLNGAIISVDTDVWTSVLDPRGWWVM